MSINSTYLNGVNPVLYGTSTAAPRLGSILLQGAVANGGAVISDPDGNPDTIGIAKYYL